MLLCYKIRHSMKLIRRFLGLLKGREAPPSREGGSEQPVVVPREKHSLSRKDIDEDAQKVLNRLIRFNHTAYLVGGGVRDLLVGRAVKDFDVATSAHPNEIKRLFRNCRLVGRRFRLAHILFRGGKVIEVSTFRRQAGFSDQDDLLIKSDNTFGTAGEDARRRDFTCNGLFYNIAGFTVIDYVGGLEDLEARIVATIGDPDVRFREDPIRILRAVRLAARLDFTIEESTRRALEKHRKEIWKGAVPRILEEVLRMLREGAARDTFGRLSEHGILEILLPRLFETSKDEDQWSQVRRVLQALDEYPRPKEGLSPALLVAALYFIPYDALLRGSPQGTDRVKLAAELLEADLAPLNFPRMQFERAKQLLAAQYRLDAIGKKRLRPSALVAKAYFQDALVLFEITRPRSRENRTILQRWRSLQKQVLAERSGEERPAEKKKDGGRGSRSRRRRRRRTPREPAAGEAAAQGPDETA